MTLVQRKDHLISRYWTFKAFTSFLSQKFDNKNPEDLVELNKLLAGPSKIPSAEPPQASPPKTPHVAQYSKQDLDQIIETFFPTWKWRLSRDKLKTRFFDNYCGQFHIECYYFCQQYKDHFTIAKASSQTKFCLKSLFFEIKSTPMDRSTKKS